MTATGGQGGGSGKIATGQTCKADGDCDSGHCASGVCCKDACGGACMACKNSLTVSLADGTCGPVGAGLKDPNGGCAAETTACGKTGFCDGKGQCELHGTTTPCGAASCSGGSYTPAATCDGKGACSAVTAQDCKGFTCSAAGGCAITCSADTECPGGYCAPMATGATTRSCAPKKSDGGTCTADNQCTNGHCVGGICCQSACTTKCYACSKTATGQDDGLCKPVLAGGASQGMCTASGGECGQDGTCDGNGGCRLAKQGTSCGTKAASCVAGNMSAAAPVCNGAGACASPGSQACGNFACNTTTGTCKQSPCTGDGDCVSGTYCNGTACVAKKAPGGTCGSQHECANGTCSADGHCCDTACAGSCFTCASGTCTAKTGNPQTNTVCNGACVDLTSDPKNCGSCGANSCSMRSMGCSAGQCTCTANTPNGEACLRPGQQAGTCWGGTCVLAAGSSGCNSAADCVPGGCSRAAGYCLGTISVAGQVSCTDTSTLFGALYIVCLAQQGCHDIPGTSRSPASVICGNGSGGTGDVTCDGPNDCPGNNDCCYEPGNGLHCLPQPQPGVIGSGCAAWDPNPVGPQASLVCDPLNPTGTCPAGKSCTPYMSDGEFAFTCG